MPAGVLGVSGVSVAGQGPGVQRERGGLVPLRGPLRSRRRGRWRPVSPPFAHLRVSKTTLPSHAPQNRTEINTVPTILRFSGFRFFFYSLKNRRAAGCSCCTKARSAKELVRSYRSWRIQTGFRAHELNRARNLIEHHDGSGGNGMSTTASRRRGYVDPDPGGRLCRSVRVRRCGSFCRTDGSCPCLWPGFPGCASDCATPALGTDRPRPRHSLARHRRRHFRSRLDGPANLAAPAPVNCVRGP